MQFKVQVLDTKPTVVGNPWRTVRTFRNQAVAERVAQNMRQDGKHARAIPAKTHRAIAPNQD